MKRTLLITFFGLLSLSLSACGAVQDVQYRAEWKDASKATIMTDSIERVIVRRLATLQFTNPVVTVVPESQTVAVVTVKTTSAEMRDTLAYILTNPFAFDLRIEKGVVPAANIENIEWEPTGIDGSHLHWVQVLGNKQTSEISLDLQFSAEGKVKLEQLAKQHQGKRVGIFVRDLLVSMLTISGSFAEHVLIGGLPSTVIAEVFADDVNVGLHVSFTPL